MHTGFNHIMLWVKDLQLAKRFYGDALKMPFISETYRMPRMFDKAYYGTESMILELFEWESPDGATYTSDYPEDRVRNKRSGITHFCIWLDSIEKTYEELRSAGFADSCGGPPSEVEPGLTPGSWIRNAMIWDPEGNPIEVFEAADPPRDSGN